jgi:hypothetical protein
VEVSASFITLADYTDLVQNFVLLDLHQFMVSEVLLQHGKGVRLRCVVHNFGYIGLGADQSNDISNVTKQMKLSNLVEVESYLLVWIKMVISV